MLQFLLSVIITGECIFNLRERSVYSLNILLFMIAWNVLKRTDVNKIDKFVECFDRLLMPSFH
jgi:hypothetical protein